ncbi:MAG: hypothetical protein AB7O65_02960 [Candidatus Korobacteraceae bacterium]
MKFVQGKVQPGYRRFGFREIAAYRPNPIAGALYMELELKQLTTPQPTRL